MKVDEPFELIEHLGTGGFAHTYRARVLDSDLVEDFGTDEVALKIPLTRQKERVLRRELVMNATLHLGLKGVQSANVVRYLGFAVFRGQIVMGMEFVPEGSLRRQVGPIGRQQPLPPEQAVSYTLGILSGLSIIHQAHVVHRDIKPENILLREGVAKIADLGIARMLDPGELASTTTGTIFYMSPETLGEKGASFPADLWAVGVTLYEMLAGRLPFGDAETPVGTMVDLIRGADAPHLCEVSRDVPRDLGEIVHRALRPNPEDRYRDADEMAECLERWRRAATDEVGRQLAALRGEFANNETAPALEARLAVLVRAHPRDPRGHQRLGEFYNRCQRYGEAIAAFQEAQRVGGESALLHWYLALAAQGLRRRPDAVRSLERAIALGLDPSLQRHAQLLLRTLRG